MAEKKKVFVIEMEKNAESLMRKITSFQPNSIILPCYGPSISPFGDVMRNIIIAVYQENVDEICVTVSKEERKNNRELFKKIVENKELQEKLHTLNYLFENCSPEFQKANMREWLEGDEASSCSREDIVNVIRNHPLMPSNVKVRELLLENKNQPEMASLRR
jgi:carbonic anhydrase